MTKVTMSIESVALQAWTKAMRASESDGECVICLRKCFRKIAIVFFLLLIYLLLFGQKGNFLEMLNANTQSLRKRKRECAKEKEKTNCCHWVCGVVE